jgi:putative protease
VNISVPILPELLAPAGSFEKLVTAIHYGADAVYLSGKRFGLRARAVNFDEDQLAEAVAYTHDRDVRLYVTVNIIAHNDDFNGLAEYLEFLGSIGVDGIIVSDPGILSSARETVPELPVHLSTQANVTNTRSAGFWIGQGVSRLNLARELSLEEIRTIRKGVGSELEIFVHGALCISYSGRCMLSQYMTDRDANQGHCSHPCRYSYQLLEEKRPDEYFPVEEDERGTYIFNSKDLCLLQRLPELVAAGADSLKLEGRMKSIFYVGGVTRIYRAALDYLKSLDSEAWEHPELITIPSELIEEIRKTGTRDITTNFIDEKPGAADMLYNSSRFDQDYEPVAVVRGVDKRVMVEARTVMHSGELVEFMYRGSRIAPARISAMQDQKGQEVTRANPGDVVFTEFDPGIPDLEVNGIFRRRKNRADVKPVPG